MAATRQIMIVAPSDPSFLEVKKLRHRVLYEPYGISSDFDWVDDAPSSLHIVAIDRGAIVGYGRLDMKGDAAHVRHLCVEPSCRRQGVGGDLLGELVDRARAKGATLAFLNARFTALGLYRRYGFVEVGPIFHTEHTHLPHKRMELALA